MFQETLMMMTGNSDHVTPIIIIINLQGEGSSMEEAVMIMGSV